MENEPIHIEKAEVGIGTVIRVIAITAMVTASAVTIYWRFDQMEKHSAVQELKRNTDIEMLNRRIERNIQKLEEHRMRIKALEVENLTRDK